jgi:hypothetical protein
LYFLSGAAEAFRGAGVDAADGGATATLAAGILTTVSWLVAGNGAFAGDNYWQRHSSVGGWGGLGRTIVEIVRLKFPS